MSSYDKKICVCVGHSRKTSAVFGSYEELIEWANEEISKNKEIKVGDIVTIENYGDIYDTLDVSYFKELWDTTDIDSYDIYKIMIHYDYGCNYGIAHNPNNENDRIKWKVLFIHKERVFIERHDKIIKPDQILCVKKSGLKKYEEV